MQYDPVKTPVFSCAKSVRSRSLLRHAASQYSFTTFASLGLVSRLRSGCSGAMTMQLTPNKVSGLVV